MNGCRRGLECFGGSASAGARARILVRTREPIMVRLRACVRACVQ